MDKVSDAQIIAATFRTVSDAEAFDDMMEAWGLRLQAQLARGTLGELDAEMREHIEQALVQFRKTEALPEANLVDEATSIAAPAMVLSPAGVVIASNESGTHTYGARQGRSVGTNWLEPRSIDDFNAVMRSAGAKGNRKQAILRTLTGGKIGLAEAYVIIDKNERYNAVAIRSLDVDWSDEIDAILTDAFGMTAAECAIARALFDMRDSAEIAVQRGTSVHTVRTQLRTIQAKTEVASQTDLVRLLTLLAHRKQDNAQDYPAGWRDPWGNEDVVESSDGMRIAYSWTGDPQGKPVLVIHNVMHGYAFPETLEERLGNAGIKLIAMQRPGFGNSFAPEYNRTSHLTALKLLIETLGLEDVVAVQFGGVLGIVRSAIRDPHLYKSILLPGMGSPYTRTVRAMMPKSTLAIIIASRRSPLLGRLMIEAAIRNARRKGVDWLGERLFTTAPADLRCLKDPEMRPSIMDAFQLTIEADPDALLWMYQTQLEDFDVDLGALTVPTHAMVGKELDYYHEPSIEQFASRSPLFTWEPVEGAGLKMLYQQPDLIADRIIAAVNA